mgnify:FL=1
MFHFTISGNSFDSVNYDEKCGPNPEAATDGIAVTILEFVGVMIWVVCIFCSCFARSANVHRRATGATGDRAPLLQLQHEHERKELGIPTRLPLAYHPRQFQNNTENPAVELRPAYTRTSRINPNQTINSAQSFPVQTDQPPRVTNNAC